MDNNDIKKIVNDEITKFVKDSLDIELKKILGDLGSKSRQELANAMKKAIEGVYKVLWQKRSFWQTDIH